MRGKLWGLPSLSRQGCPRGAEFLTGAADATMGLFKPFFVVVVFPRLCCLCWQAEYCLFSLSPVIPDCILMELPSKMGYQLVALGFFPAVLVVLALFSLAVSM